MTATTEIAHSSYLDFSAYGLLQPGTNTVAAAFGFSDSEVETADDTYSINVALVLHRATDPTALLESDWGTRQKTLQSMSSEELWTKYGADKTTYDQVKTELEHSGYTVLGSNPATTGDYVTSAESRTIWLSLTASQFKALFGTDLMVGGITSNGYSCLFWNGNLSLPSTIAAAVDGLWVDDGENPPPGQNLAGNVSVTLPQGAQSIGNWSDADSDSINFFPQDIAKGIYNFPLSGETVNTGMIGLIEPNIGTSVPGTVSFQTLLEQYWDYVGVTGTGVAYTQGEAGAQTGATSTERSLDVGIVTAINPNSDLALYVGSGYNGMAYSSVYTAYQSAFWQTPEGLTRGTRPAVISSSWGDLTIQAPDSPFYRAYAELYKDAALQNQTVVEALGDGGSGNGSANGVTNVEANSSSAFTLVVGGTSVSVVGAANEDTTLTSVLASAEAGTLATLWQLIAGGLKTPVSDQSGVMTFIETVWNDYYVTASNKIENGYLTNNTSSGGVDTTQATPRYQIDYGLTPTDLVSGLPGRGVPDVTANAGGNMYYLTPQGDMTLNTSEGGTSAAAPVWAALLTQINTIFSDQGLPNLGYMNDLIYQAAAIAPGAFNDITMGNNTSSFYLGGSYTTKQPATSEQTAVTPTGYGYEAGTGYDLVSGLGSPNGLLLARALTAIAHTQMSYDPTPVLEGAGAGWTSSVTQSLLFQATSPANTDIALQFSTQATAVTSGSAAAYAWTAQFAQQSLQSDFSSDLVTLFDRQAQGRVYEAHVEAGATVSVSIGGAAATAYQAALTSDYGFVDFANAHGTVEVARPVAVAFTAGGADDADVVVRLRQNGMNDSAVTFYKVDDYAGTINGIAPGQTGYAAAAATRAYHTDTGATAISGAGYGQFSQAKLSDVDHGDLVAMSLSSGGHTYWGFSSANEKVNGVSVGHLWSYGLNTWGWEDQTGGGDADYNDLVVQLDFTSATGHDWLV